MPKVEAGDQCRNPYECAFLEHCLVPGPACPVQCLPYGRNVVKELMEQGIRDIRDIPEGKLSKPTHERVRRVTKSGKAEIDPAIVAILKRFSYPRYFLDFETVTFAVPRWRGTRPYQPIPFQWSCHIEHSDGSVEHNYVALQLSIAAGFS